MATSARVVLDSVSPVGVRLTTMEVTLHRWVLAELNTHRIFSRNSASSRAIPVQKQLDKVKDDPAYPVSWPAEQPGMQGGDELTGADLEAAQAFYGFIHEKVWREVEAYIKMTDGQPRLHKSVLNRFLEPFMWHTVLISSTGWENFWGLRCSPLAQPEIRVAAEMMHLAFTQSTPTPLAHGEWHMPFTEDIDDLKQTFNETEIQFISSARCGRISYLTHGTGVKDPTADLLMARNLQTARPIHASPFEHVARPEEFIGEADANFRGWVQLRELLEHPTTTKR